MNTYSIKEGELLRPVLITILTGTIGKKANDEPIQVLQRKQRRSNNFYFIFSYSSDKFLKTTRWHQP